MIFLSLDASNSIGSAKMVKHCFALLSCPNAPKLKQPAKCIRNGHNVTNAHSNNQNTIGVRGARQHNLKNIDLELPRDQLIVFTGVSGSGKSSLAFDTIFAEGDINRYVESSGALSAPVFGQLDKPDVDAIEGLSPAISIDQKSTSPRQTRDRLLALLQNVRLSQIALRQSRRTALSDLRSLHYANN